MKLTPTPLLIASPDQEYVRKIWGIYRAYIIGKKRKNEMYHRIKKYNISPIK